MNPLPGILGNARTIDEVIWQLDQIIAMSMQTKNKIGYFASLYRMVTVRVKEGILKNEFENGARMERLDVCFANFYLNALNDYLNGKPTSISWQVAFRCSQKRRPIVLQHLLLGINAHINLDLGIAAAMTCKNLDILTLHDDFMKINSILASLVDEVRSDLDYISPWIGFLDRIDQNSSKAIINFSLVKARNYAWDFALKLAAAKETDWEQLIKVRNDEIATIGKKVAYPGNWLLKTGLWVIRLRESNNIGRNMDLLNHYKFETKPEGRIHCL
ncbi:hypothetical protein BIV60_21570 [Bacillus sp. MUM 116]|uniref:DUF5995 family protein n=1 Tax=Bacillus sp. MUM 116 TaxID=1678002 RepID=UPI0008F5617D|nr:DUF5995 family protein [Bacillus sp. MUM 116]OIK10340.1 hypothetical protein BIV60_21570 [Bacillus sp. MUM 116]